MTLRGGQEPAAAAGVEEEVAAASQAKLEEFVESEEAVLNILKQASDLKDEGNRAFQSNVVAAMELYTSAYLLTQNVRNEKFTKEITKIQIACLTNKALAALQLNKYKEAFACCSLALEMEPTNFKALYRRAFAWRGLGSLQDARDDLVSALQVQPSNEDASSALQAINAEIEQLESSSTNVNAAHAEPMEGGQDEENLSTSSLCSSISAARKIKHRIAGLKNEGATCYLNAVLQTLFHLPALRRAIYRIPTVEPRGELPSVSLALQRLFWNLHKSPVPQSTTELLVSFGWDSADSLMQQDISDFCHMLFDIVEEGMKNTTVEGEITKLLGVKVQYTDSVESVSWSKQREDVSMVTLLHGIRESRSVLKSLELLTKPEIIEGYDTEVHGKQTVHRSLRFKELPPILLLNINRIEFCPVALEPVKINDRFEFPAELDMSQFTVRSEGEQEGRARYSLCSVIVHMGSANMGHYVAYCRPAGEQGKWFCFDDDHVAEVGEEEAIDNNFGNDNSPSLPVGGLYMRSVLQKMRSAYMLCYVRSDCFDEVMNTTGLEEEVPPHVKEGTAGSVGFSLPISITVLTPDGGESKLDEEEGGGEQQQQQDAEGVMEGVEQGNDTLSEERKRFVRGRAINLTISSPETKTIADILSEMIRVAEANGKPMLPPSAEEFLGAEVEQTPPAAMEEEEVEEAQEGSRSASETLAPLETPNLKLCLTSVRNHMIQCVYPEEERASEGASSVALSSVLAPDSCASGRFFPPASRVVR
eukprot:767701-Hanusia_phi.AAC.10